MPRHTVATLPETHRRAREILRKRWQDRLPDDTPAWTATVDGKDSVLAATDDNIVIITPGLMGAEFELPCRSVQPTRTGAQVALRTQQDWSYQLVFDDDSAAAGFTAAMEAGAARAGDAVASARRREAKIRACVVVTVDHMPGAEIVQVHGDVVGSVVRARHIFSNMGASLRTVAGGEAAGYTKLVMDTRRQARDRLVEEAVGRGANAVVGMRYDSTEIADLMSEVTAYGTAVTVRFPDSPHH